MFLKTFIVQRTGPLPDSRTLKIICVLNTSLYFLGQHVLSFNKVC